MRGSHICFLFVLLQALSALAVAVTDADLDTIDSLVFARLEEATLTPAPLCDDDVFFRRVYLDVLGMVPQPREVIAFLNDASEDKRARCIDALLERDEFADYWSLKWCDLLRVKSEFPINLWPNAVQAYHRWIHDAIRHNMPYDAFARTLLTASGSNFRTPPVNFYRAMQEKNASSIAAAAALTFMGTRIEYWPENERKNLESFFSRVAYKPTDEWKEVIVHLDPAPAPPLKAVLPDGTRLTIPGDEDPRFIFAAWLVSPDNEWFSRAIVNRIWSWLLGRGIIHEPDDIRADSMPANPELLAFLEKELVRSQYDLRHIYRIILNSATYQQRSVAPSPAPENEVLFGHYPVRPIEAEVLADILNDLFGGNESYSSLIPEPFTHIPEYNRTVMLADGSISSTFLETFGRSARDTGLESERNRQITEAQRLSLLNSSHLQKRISGSIGKLQRGPNGAQVGAREALHRIYLSLLSRYPTPDEVKTVNDYLIVNNLKMGETAEDLVWALINSKEFLYRH